ncbi:MAG: hypothetical protein ACREBE_24530 [bacterium]
MTLGATFGAGTSFAIAARPELLWMHLRRDRLDHRIGVLGIGGYGEIGRVAAANERGAGVTLAFGSSSLGCAPSIGIMQRDHQRSVAGSVFLGMLEVDYFDHYHVATGIRIDVRRLDSETATTVSYQLDVVLPVLAAGVFTGLGHR